MQPVLRIVWMFAMLGTHGARSRRPRHVRESARSAGVVTQQVGERSSAVSTMHAHACAHWDAPLYEHFPLYLECSLIYEIQVFGAQRVASSRAPMKCVP
jgi:hypothetical protein